MTENGNRTLVLAKKRPSPASVREAGFLHGRGDPLPAGAATITSRLEGKEVGEQHPSVLATRQPLRRDLALV